VSCSLDVCIVFKGGGWSDKTPLQKYRAFQAYRTFLSREPPKALGSKEIPQVNILMVAWWCICKICTIAEIDKKWKLKCTVCAYNLAIDLATWSAACDW